MNVGAFTPAVFGTAKPLKFETWHCTAMRQRVELTRGDFLERETFAFAREQFLRWWSASEPGARDALLLTPRALPTTRCEYPSCRQ